MHPINDGRVTTRPAMLQTRMLSRESATMASAAEKLPKLMTVPEFLTWPGDGTGRIYELVEGEPRAQDSASDGHGTIQANVIRLLGNHILDRRLPCRVVSAPGIQPKLRSDWNYRVPEIAVTCTPHQSGVHKTPDPILIVEVLSPSNAQDTWNNVALFATLPSVREILVLESGRVGADLLRRGENGEWPANSIDLKAGDTVELGTIELSMPLVEAYRGTDLAPL